MTISEKQLSAYSFQALSKDFEGIRPLNVQMSFQKMATMWKSMKWFTDNQILK